MTSTTCDEGSGSHDAEPAGGIRTSPDVVPTLGRESDVALRCAYEGCDEVAKGVSTKSKQGGRQTWMCKRHKNKTYKAKYKKKKAEWKKKKKKRKKKISKEELDVVGGGNVEEDSSMQPTTGVTPQKLSLLLEQSPTRKLTNIEQVLFLKRQALLRSPAVIALLQEGQKVLADQPWPMVQECFMFASTAAASRVMMPLDERQQFNGCDQV
uniref:Regulatory factor X-associated protein RFXANK-binding domain-containing protein n=1 Tax=Eptatretus burgeri TaxID=7764 RepID=A0A8C4PX59_EPTBU